MRSSTCIIFNLESLTGIGSESYPIYLREIFFVEFTRANVLEFTRTCNGTVVLPARAERTSFNFCYIGV